MTYRNKHGDFITVCYLPKRKKICLVVGEDENGTKVASFDDDEDKRECIRCPHCKEYPFEDTEIQTYEFDRVVMFAREQP